MRPANQSKALLFFAACMSGLPVFVFHLAKDERASSKLDFLHFSVCLPQHGMGELIGKKEGRCCQHLEAS